MNLEINSIWQTRFVQLTSFGFFIVRGSLTIKGSYLIMTITRAVFIWVKDRVLFKIGMVTFITNHCTISSTGVLHLRLFSTNLSASLVVCSIHISRSSLKCSSDSESLHQPGESSCNKSTGNHF